MNQLNVKTFTGVSIAETTLPYTTNRHVWPSTGQLSNEIALKNNYLPNTQVLKNKPMISDYHGPTLQSIDLCTD